MPEKNMTMPDRLQGCRILVVEDETLLAATIEEILQDLGCVVIGPMSKLEAALQSAANDSLDAAVLDISIRGGMVFPAAEKLLARHIPFLFASGYGEWALPEGFADWPRLTKPFTAQELETAVRSLLTGSSAAERDHGERCH
jgi:DNA-binding response OmpR family regulator